MTTTTLHNTQAVVKSQENKAETLDLEDLREVFIKVC